MKSRWIASVGLFALSSILACASTQIGSPDDYEPVPLNRVVPYPSDEELAQQTTGVVLAASYTEELSTDEVGGAVAALQTSLERYLDEAGADVSRRSRSDFGDADWAIVARITRYEHTSAYSDPTGLFKSEEELEGEPGTCTHTGVVDADLSVYRAPESESAYASLQLHETDDFSEKQLDKTCPLSDSRRQVLLDDILNASIPCLEIPIKNRFSPRGYVLEQRSSEAGGKQIYKTSLGRSNGARAGLELSIFRVQHMTTDDGNEARRPLKIAEAVVTDQMGDDYSWISIKPRSMQQPLLAGDLVRGVYEDTLAAGFGLGKCKRILTVTVDR
jgi:hypothetical protein